MRKSNWMPSIVPRGDDHDVYLVVDDLGRIGRVWREADYEAANVDTVVADLLTGQYKIPSASSHSTQLRAGRGTCRPTSQQSCARRCDLQSRDVQSDLQGFVDRHDAIDRSQLILPLRLV